MTYVNNMDPLFYDAAKLVVTNQSGSASLISRTFKIGYDRTSLLMDQLEEVGIVGPFEGNKHRDVLISDEYSLEELLKKIKAQ